MLISIQRYFFALLSLSTKIKIIIASKKYFAISIVEDQDLVVTCKLDCLVINNDDLVRKT